MTIPVGTKVLWEAPSPDGPYFPNVLKEGRVSDLVSAFYRCDWLARRKIENDLVYNHATTELGLRDGYVLVVTGIYAIPNSADDIHVVRARELVY